MLWKITTYNIPKKFSHHIISMFFIYCLLIRIRLSRVHPKKLTRAYWLAIGKESVLLQNPRHLSDVLSNRNTFLSSIFAASKQMDVSASTVKSWTSVRHSYQWQWQGENYFSTKASHGNAFSSPHMNPCVLMTGLIAKRCVTFLLVIDINAGENGFSYCNGNHCLFL